jgi:hypothetical protein
MLSEFTLFPELPKELRLEVWTMAAKEPRIIEIYQFYCYRDPIEESIPDSIEGFIPEDDDDDDDEESEFLERINLNPFYSPAALPAILHVNQESRDVALKHYQLSFPNAENPAAIYWNPAVDTLYFRSGAGVTISRVSSVQLQRKSKTVFSASRLIT